MTNSMNINMCHWTQTSAIPFQSASGSLFTEYVGKEVKLSLSMLLGHIWEVVVQLHSFLTLELDGGERLTSCLGCLTQEKEPLVPIE